MSADLPIFRCGGCPAQAGCAGVRDCSRLRQGADGCHRCRHGSRQIYERTFREVVVLGRTLRKRAADVLAYFDRPGTSNGPALHAPHPQPPPLAPASIGLRRGEPSVRCRTIGCGGIRRHCLSRDGLCGGCLSRGDSVLVLEQGLAFHQPGEAE